MHHHILAVVVLLLGCGLHKRFSVHDSIRSEASIELAILRLWTIAFLVVNGGICGAAAKLRRELFDFSLLNFFFFVRLVKEEVDHDTAAVPYRLLPVLFLFADHHLPYLCKVLGLEHLDTFFIASLRLCVRNLVWI